MNSFRITRQTEETVNNHTNKLTSKSYNYRKPTNITTISHHNQTIASTDQTWWCTSHHTVLNSKLKWLIHARMCLHLFSQSEVYHEQMSPIPGSSRSLDVALSNARFKGVMTRSMVDALSKLLSGLHHFAIMALILPDRGEKLHSEILFLHFVEHFFYIDLCNYLCTCKRIFQTSARKPRNQCKHQQLCVNFLSRGQFCCADGLQNASPRALSMRIG